MNRTLTRTLAATGAVVGAAALALAPTAAFANGSGGVTGPAFYIDGQLFRTVATPTDLSGTGAPASSFQPIYSFGGAQLSVATAAQGDPGFRGGRWQVHALAFPNGYAAALAAGDTNHDGVIDSYAELQVAMGAGDAVDTGIVKEFVCTVVPYHP